MAPYEHMAPYETGVVTETGTRLKANPGQVKYIQRMRALHKARPDAVTLKGVSCKEQFEAIASLNEKQRMQREKKHGKKGEQPTVSPQ